MHPPQHRSSHNEVRAGTQLIEPEKKPTTLGLIKFITRQHEDKLQVKWIRTRFPCSKWRKSAGGDCNSIYFQRRLEIFDIF
jgi:hypothetical protein